MELFDLQIRNWGTYGISLLAGNPDHYTNQSYSFLLEGYVGRCFNGGMKM